MDVLQSTQNQVHVYDPSHVYKTLPPKSPVRESQKNRVNGQNMQHKSQKYCSISILNMDHTACTS